MNIKLQLPKLTHLRPRITVVGVGGAGSNAVNNMITSGLGGVNFVVANTDSQSLANSGAEHRIQLGAALTEGLGAGARPEIGKASAEEAIEEIRAQVAGSHMVFVAAGMGGGTGTGAAAVIARIARECGALTVGVVTKPFHFEGTRRMRAAEIGIAALKPEVDTLLVIPNQNLFRIANERTTFAEAFVLADQVLYSGIACVVDLIVKEGLINLDFADVRTIMSGMGTAMMGTGEATGDKRAVLAAEEAISNPLLDDISLRGAKGLLVSITGSRDLKLYEVDEAATRVRQEVDGEANIIVGATFDDTLGDRLRVSIVASGMERLSESNAWQPATRPQLASPIQSGPPDTQPPFMEPYPEHYGQHAPAQIAAPVHAPVDFVPHAAAPPVAQPPSYANLGPQTQGYRSQPAPADFTRALSEALESQGDVQTAYRQPAPQQQSGSWSSQSGAVFEDAPPQVAGDNLSSIGQQPATPRGTRADAGFYPQPPADTRRANRRLPDVEDFPLVGQREYLAKAGHYADKAGESKSPAVPHRAYVQPAPEPPRKRGFFERLMGSRRKGTPEATQTSDYPQAADRTVAERERPMTDGRHRAVSAVRGASRRNDEDNELPVFFGADRK